MSEGKLADTWNYMPADAVNPPESAPGEPPRQTEPGAAKAARRTDARRSLKRALDLAAGGVACVVAFPICLLIAVIIKLDSKGPVIFSSDRVGLHGRVFKLYKFRSMVVDADARLKDLAHLNLGGSRMVKIANDPRVTRVGRILRKYSLDEIPQLWNVIRGDMSLVGPRPQAPTEVELYDERQQRRLSVPAGITGWWQVTARNDPRFEVWIAKDLEYIESWSLGLDIKILLKTIFVVLAGKDAAPRPRDGAA